MASGGRHRSHKPRCTHPRLAAAAERPRYARNLPSSWARWWRNSTPPPTPPQASDLTVCSKLFLPTALIALAQYLQAPSPKNLTKREPQQRRAGQHPYAQRDDAMQFADDLAERRGLDREWVRQAVGQARFLGWCPSSCCRPPKARPRTGVYRSRFIDPIRIRAGVRFWQEHREAWHAEQEYGVPAEIIVGIIGVETIYGQQMGNFA